VERADALIHLQNQFAPLASVVDQPTTDSAAGYGPALDQALRKLGYTADQLATAVVPDADVLDYLTLAEYYALERYALWFTVAVDEERQFGSGTRRRDNLAGKVTALLTERRAALTELGYIGTVWEGGALVLDFLEPSADT
jgi:hypothetical protein